MAIGGNNTAAAHFWNILVAPGLLHTAKSPSCSDPVIRVPGETADFLFGHYCWDSRGDAPKSEPATE